MGGVGVWGQMTTLKKPLFIVFTLGFFLFGCSSLDLNGGLTEEQKAGTIIVYGGLGFLHQNAQPSLAEMLRIRQDDEESVPLVGRMVRDKVKGQQLERVSNYPIVLSDEEFATALASKQDIEANQVLGSTIRDEVAGSSIYVVSLIGGLEQDYDLIQNAGGQRIVQRIALVTVTAVLSKPASGEILLTRDATTQINDRSGEEASERLSRLADAYADAAGRALETLTAAARRIDLGNQEKTMVTGVAVTATDVLDLFDMKSTDWRSGPDICSLPAQCTSGGAGTCQSILSAMAQLTTEALGTEGETMLPPWSWAAWGETSTNELGRNIGTLRIKTTGGFRWVEDQLKLVLEPDQATRKIVAVLDRFDMELADDSNPYLRTRTFSADLALNQYRNTSGAPCSAAQPDGVFDDIGGSAVVAIKESRDLPESLEDDLLRSYTIISIRQALGKGASS